MVYVVTLVVIAVILLASYRALGTTTVSDDDVDKFVGNVHEWVKADAGGLEFLASADSPSDADIEAARNVRKKLAGYQQQLNRLLEDGERSQLSLAIEALGWACRMVETGSTQVNSGVRDAASDLYRYGIDLLSSEISDGVSNPLLQVPLR